MVQKSKDSKRHTVEYFSALLPSLGNHCIHFSSPDPFCTYKQIPIYTFISPFPSTLNKKISLHHSLFWKQYIFLYQDTEGLHPCSIIWLPVCCIIWHCCHLFNYSLINRHICCFKIFTVKQMLP